MKDKVDISPLYSDYIFDLSEELSLNGFPNTVKVEGGKFVIEHETMFGLFRYEPIFDNVMKEYYRFFQLYGNKLSKYGLNNVKLINY